MLARELRGCEDGVTIRFGTSRGEPGSGKNTTISTDTVISELITWHGANAKVSAPTSNKDRKRLHRAAWEVAAVASTLRRRLSTSSAALLASAA